MVVGGARELVLTLLRAETQGELKEIESHYSTQIEEMPSNWAENWIVFKYAICKL